MALTARVLVILGGSLLSAGGGVVAGALGGRQIRRAQRQIDKQYAAYEIHHGAHMDRVNDTNARLSAYGLTQERAQRAVIFRMKDYLERHQRLVRANEHLILEGLDDGNVPVVGLTHLPADATSWARGIAGSVGAGAMTSGAMKAAVHRLGKAGTGRPLASLHGVAAKNATAAWWGGGSLAQGGGGMAMGRLVQQAPTIGPAILVAGLAVKNEGTKATTAAEQHRATIEIEIARLSVRDQTLRAVCDRTHELDGILTKLTEEAVNSLDALEAATTDVTIPAEPFQRAMILVKSVRDVATASIVDEHGELDTRTDEIVVRYRSLEKKAHDE